MTPRAALTAIREAYVCLTAGQSDHQAFADAVLEALNAAGPVVTESEKAIGYVCRFPPIPPMR